MPILLTEKAAGEIKTIINQQGLNLEGTKLRVGVKGGGCNGVKILVDMKSYLYLNGTEIDFKDEVMGRGFVFKNPNATSTCGCGSSFQA
jgi:Fe-S cluster assembly iron-binding protein IscA